MEWKLESGDYVPDGAGGMTALSGGEKTLARVLFRLTARRGGLPFLPRLGSRLYQLGREKPSARQALAAQYVAEALEDEPGLSVREVELVQSGDSARLTVYLDWQGEKLTARLPLPGADGRPEGVEQNENH